LKEKTHSQNLCIHQPQIEKAENKSLFTQKERERKE
jgi:hypothetical protein